MLYTTGLSRSTVYEMMSRRQFPLSLLSGKNVARLASEVEQWMDERIANRHQEAAMMRLTFGRQHFTLSDNDALFIAEAILLQRKELGVVLSTAAKNTALSVWRVAKPSRACSVPGRCR